jgi:UDP-N-acetylglucosamine transferase subunit ALG13
MKCFVTVGSTQFKKLIDIILTDNILQKFLKIGIDKIIIQNGSGQIPECLINFKRENDEIWITKLFGIEVVFIFEFKFESNLFYMSPIKFWDRIRVSSLRLVFKKSNRPRTIRLGQ